jgi:hypothetical protein
MGSIFVRAGLVALVAASIVASTGIGRATEIPKPVPRPSHEIGATPTPTSLDRPALLPPPTGPVQTYSYGRVILMRGLMNVFSRGLDSLQIEMKQRGLPVELYNHTAWTEIADKLVAEYKTNKSVEPIIIIGHSLGADAAVVMTNWLAEHNVPVRLVVTLDGVGDGLTVAGGSTEIINYYKPHQFGQEILKSKAFRGTITNIDLSDHPDIGHLNIDKNADIHNQIITKVLEIMKKKPTVTAKG